MSSSGTTQGTSTQIPVRDTTDGSARDTIENQSDPWASTRKFECYSERGQTSERSTRRGQGSRSVSLIVTKPTEPSVKKIMMKTNGYFVLNGEVEADEAVLPHIERDYARAQDKFRTLLGRHVGLHGPLQTQLVEQGSTEMAPVKVHTLLEGYIRGREIAKGTKTLFLQGPYYLSDYEQEGTEGLAERSE
ncbi:hypothetical protein I204_04266 [Kwoniella mangroviensis CBS 8886]|nr:hypothetical protein I204_04266 [Kwoniella mangroviensis CBS 8886]